MVNFQGNKWVNPTPPKQGTLKEKELFSDYSPQAKN